MFNKKHNIISALIVSFIIGISMYLYRYNVTKELDIGNKEMLYEISIQQKHNIESDISDKISSLNNLSGIAGALITSETISEVSPEIIFVFQGLESNFGFDNIIIAQLDGHAILNDGSQINIAEHQFFKDAITHDTFISSYSHSPISNKDSTFFSSSVYNPAGDKIGVIIGELEANSFESDLSAIFDSAGIYILTDSNGTVISKSKESTNLEVGDNILNYSDIALFDKNQEFENLEQILHADSTNGSVKYTLNDEEKILNFFTIDSTDWKLIMSIPTSAISGTSNAIIANTFLISTEVVIILLSVLISTLRIHKKYTASVEEIAYYDKLTGLMNITKFKSEMKKILNKDTETNYIIAKMDIINFKVINELYDYHMGDKVLKVISEALKTVVSDDFLIAKGDGDEFLFFTTVEKLTAVFSVNPEYEKMINIGISTICTREFKFRYSRYKIPLGETNVDDILNTLTLTHNHHRSTLKLTSSFYDFEESLKTNLVHTVFICDIMRDALDNEEFKVYLQPKTNIKTKKIYGAEALVRWQRPDGRFIFPNEFIPIFEQEGFIVELDKYMLKKVCAIIRRFLDAGHQVPISINFSRLHMLNENFTEELTAIADSFNIPHELIEIEMTETSMMEDIDSFKRLSSDLHATGFSLSIDDFGAGYSSFDLLADLDFDVLKIDKSLLDQAENSKKGEIVVQTIVDMAKNLSLKSVCEGVETQAQLNFLESINCDIAQGYYFSKPIPNEEFDKLLNN